MSANSLLSFPRSTINVLAKGSNDNLVGEGRTVDNPYLLDIDIKHCITNAGPGNTQDFPRGAQPDVCHSDAVLRDSPCLEGGEDKFKSRAEIFRIWAFVANMSGDFILKLIIL
jgi:hypothetical protein